MAVVVAASRIRHPLDARTLARLAAQHAGEGPGSVVGFGLSNDERRGVTEEFAPRLRDRPPGRAGPGPPRGRAAGAGRGGDDPRGPVARPARPRRAQRGGPPGAGAAWPRPASRSRSARGSNVALGVYATAAEVPLRDDRGRRHTRGARAPTTRCSSARGWPRSTRGPARPWASPTRSSPAWHSGPCEASRAPEPLRRPPGPTSPTGWPRPRADGASAAHPGQSEWPTKTGSLTRVTPKASRTPSRTSRARAATSAAVAPPRLVTASVCLVDSAARAGQAEALGEPGLVDEPGRAGLDVAVGVGEARRRGTIRAQPLGGPGLEGRELLDPTGSGW